MPYQVSAGYTALGRDIKVPQTFIPHVMRTYIYGVTPDLTQMLNVLHTANGVGSVGLGDCEAVNAIVATWVSAYYADLVSNQINFTGVHTRSMEGLIVPNATTPLTVVGTEGGDCLPYATTLTCELTSGLTGRRNKGSFHAFPTTEANNESNQHPLVAYCENVAAALETLRTTLDTAGYPLIIASYRYETYITVTGVEFSLKWGTVVSRKIGRGR